MAVLNSRDAVPSGQKGGHVLKIVEQQATPELSNGIACGSEPACIMVPPYTMMVL